MTYENIKNFFLKIAESTGRNIIRNISCLAQIAASLAAQLFATNRTQADAIFTCPRCGNVNEITRDFLVSPRRAMRAAIHQFSNVATYAITAINNCASVVWKSAVEEPRHERRGKRREGSDVLRQLIFNSKFACLLSRGLLFLLIVLPRALLSDRECARASWKFMVICDR